MTKAEIEERELRVMRDDALGILHDFKYPDHIYKEGVSKIMNAKTPIQISNALTWARHANDQ